MLAILSVPSSSAFVNSSAILGLIIPFSRNKRKLFIATAWDSCASLSCSRSVITFVSPILKIILVPLFSLYNVVVTCHRI